ncbi:MerR family transcriptional regulator [Agromyces atrinae]|uniref:MerR family transcriptional regulator n=1 Tax=Agromyces atrinae TaxID=592376 RepID=UPI001F57202A|nr:MerR family transcriptional regulator [Agromyces atrinae]MCI2959069.1 MerR family transcriptional regulator [Agromyces atrinae]
MRIGEVAARSGASIRSIRYYEECGLLDPVRSGSGQRHYDESSVERVVIIKQLLAAGLGTTAVADVLPCLAEPATQTSSVTARLRVERDRLSVEIAERLATRDALDAIIDAAPPLPR